MQSLFSKIKPLLRQVHHPSRYIGQEFNAPIIDALANQFNFCMVYPDVYDIGQSNQAVRILCNKVNELEGFAAQRSFLPEPKTIEYFKMNDISMFSLETFSPLNQFDAIGITVSHDLLATNIVEVLDFSKIPIFSKDRRDDDVYVFGGGPMYCNPEPYHSFFDVITIGEGEVATTEALKKLKNLKKACKSRKEILHELAKMPSIYIPSLYELSSEDTYPHPIHGDIPEKIKRSIYIDFAKSNAYENCIVPYVEIVHDRLNVEILRGCARGCRFCQAGIMYRPVRERSQKNICSAVIDGLCDTGYNEVSLTSLSTTDHSQISEILTELNSKLEHKAVRISIPSQRLDSFGVNMAKLVSGNKKGGLTFAIEAGSQRLRDVINKNVCEDDIFEAVDSAFKNGWNRAKLYFMIGLPTETDDDVISIAEICEKVLKCAKEAAGERRSHGIKISASCAIFVPKAQTPFMYDGQISTDEAIRRVNLIRQNIKSKAISFSWHNPQTSYIEAVLSRGDRNCSMLIYEAWKAGSRFDAWDEHFNFDAWKTAAHKCNINMEEYATKQFNYDDNFAWSHIDFGLDNEFLILERKKADLANTTEDCTFGKCSNCGVCKNLGVKNEIQGKR